MRGILGQPDGDAIGQPDGDGIDSLPFVGEPFRTGEPAATSPRNSPKPTEFGFIGTTVVASAGELRTRDGSLLGEALIGPVRIDAWDAVYFRIRPTEDDAPDRHLIVGPDGRVTDLVEMDGEEEPFFLMREDDRVWAFNSTHFALLPERPTGPVELPNAFPPPSKPGLDFRFTRQAMAFTDASGAFLIWDTSNTAARIDPATMEVEVGDKYRAPFKGRRQRDNLEPIFSRASETSAFHYEEQPDPGVEDAPRYWRGGRHFDGTAYYVPAAILEIGGAGVVARGPAQTIGILDTETFATSQIDTACVPDEVLPIAPPERSLIAYSCGEQHRLWSPEGDAELPGPVVDGVARSETEVYLTKTRARLGGVQSYEVSGPVFVHRDSHKAWVFSDDQRSRRRVGRLACPDIGYTLSPRGVREGVAMFECVRKLGDEMTSNRRWYVDVGAESFWNEDSVRTWSTRIGHEGPQF